MAGCITLACLTGAANAAPAVNLQGYADATGAISVVHSGDTADPYFALQALLLAHDNGLDIAAPAENFVRWLLPLQKPDGTFDRFCKSSPASTWAACKAADADDALLALWMRLLQAQPKLLASEPLWAKSHARSKAALAHLFQPSRGVYMVSPVVLHGLFMDNLEVWSYKAAAGTGQPAEAKTLAQAIDRTFWNPATQRYLVSTQLEQGSQKPAFYPDHVAQIFPLLVDFVQPNQPARTTYSQWMNAHRAEWLRQGEKDYPWGILAVLAARQGDAASAGCWLRVSSRLQHSPRWAVTDEVAWQVLQHRRMAPALPNAPCD